MNTFLSIDVGTSSTKLTLFDGTGQLLSSASKDYPVEYPQPEWAEQDPRVWWQAVCELGGMIFQNQDKNLLKAISVSGQTPLCVPIDRKGNLLRKALLWLDRRATQQVEWLRAHIGEDRCRAVSKNRIDSYFGGVKWLWLQQQEPAVFSNTWKILQANSYIIFHLTGAAVIDPSQAGLCSPCYNPFTKSWDEDMCSLMGIPVGILPDIFPSYQVVGFITGEASRLTGLPAGTPVVCGGGDFACSCLSTGVAGQSQAALMLGTAGNLLFPGADSHDPRLLHTIHLTGEPLPLGGVMAGGNLSWFAGLFGEQAPGFFSLLDGEAEKIPPGSEGLIFLPYLLGERTPIWDPYARGAFVGLTTRHTRAHLYRAILEGVAFAFRQIAEIASTNRTGKMDKIVAIDGGSRSRVWRSILASVIGVPVIEGGDRSGTALGSAFLAAYGVGQVRSFDEITTWTQHREETLPAAGAASRYNQLYPVYSGLYEKLKEDFSHLNALVEHQQEN